MSKILARGGEAAWGLLVFGRTKHLLKGNYSRANIEWARYWIDLTAEQVIPAAEQEQRRRPREWVAYALEVSDDLYRRAKAEAAERGRKLKDLVKEGLRLVLEAPRQSHRRRSLAALMKGAREAVDSGVPDPSNPEYLTGFGHDARRHR